MSQLLHIDCSARTEGSFSRMLSQQFVEDWRSAHPGGTVITRDLAADPLPYLDELAVSGMFIPPEDRTPQMQAALALSDRLTDELLASDRIVIGVPMYNFHVPAPFKSWIDHVVRAGRTFTYTEEGPVGLATGKKVLAVSARGGSYAATGPYHERDLQTPWLRLIFGFIGIRDVEIVRCEGTAINGELLENSLAAAQARLKELVACW